MDFVSFFSLVALVVKSLPAMFEILILSLGQEDPLEKEMAIHFTLLPGKSHGCRSLVQAAVHGVTKSWT